MFEIPSGADRDLYMQKALWARMLDTSVEAVESRIANRELIIKLGGESMTAAEAGINFNFLRKIPRFDSFLRAERPDLYKSEPVHNGLDQLPSENWEIDPGGVDTSSYLSEPVPQGKTERHSPVPSAPEPVSSQETSDQERVSPERFDKAQQLIDQYGTEEGLRRFREMDPEAARQYEFDQSRPERERNESPTRQPRETR